MPEYTGAEQLALAESLAGIIPTLYLEKADDAYYIAEVIVDSEWLAAVRAEAGAAALEAAAEKLDGGRCPDYVTEHLRVRAAALRFAPEGEHTEPELDPTPWFNAQATPQRSDHERYWDLFDPRPEFSQDPAHYPGGTR